jgi:hypothetical protein
MRITASVLLSLVTTVSHVVCAQHAPIATRGQSVLVRSPDASEWRGHLIAPLYQDDATALICRGRPGQCNVDSMRVVRLARADGVALQLRTGSSWRKGALIGGVTGAALATTWALLYHLDDASSAEDGRAGRIVIGTAAITAVGALVGGLIGSRDEQWDSVWR